MEWPAIELEGVDKVFDGTKSGSVKALAAIDLTVRRGEFLAIVGPSGCGKSTILRLIAGLLPPSRGRVAIDGTPVHEPRDEIGIVFQRPTLLPWLNIRDNVLFPVRHKRGESGRAYFGETDALLAMVGLADFAAHMPDQLSGGMQQRAAIARALLLDPQILLMDEPFSALDALTRDEMSFELMRIWQERPKTVVFITHAIGEAVLLADRVAIMTPRPGKIETVVPIDLPRPRTIETMTSPRFLELSHDIRARVLRRVAQAA